MLNCYGGFVIAVYGLNTCGYLIVECFCGLMEWVYDSVTCNIEMIE